MKLQVKVSTRGADKIAANMDRADKFIAQVAQRIVREAKLLIQHGVKTGFTYTVKGRKHIASAPGEAPANVFGVLANSIIRRKIRPLLYMVNVGASYGAILELLMN
ncbi:MAG: hypothetical protein EOO82_02145, partial [Oxalobacteraceae bacterium]